LLTSIFERLPALGRLYGKLSERRQPYERIGGKIATLHTQLT
jgi:hypothetical protein